MKELTIVGKSIPKIDAYDKVTGKAKYVGDMRLPNMLYAKILRSPHAHAEITSIDTSAAKTLPGVKAVVTYENVPSTYFTMCGHPHPPDTPEDTLIINKTVRYVGDIVAAVAAETEQIAQQALSMIQVEYKILPAYFTPSDALQEGAYEIHPNSKNIIGDNEYQVGNVEKAFQQADYIIEDCYKTPIIAHSQLEPHVSLVDIDGTGKITAYVANQVPNIMRERLAKALELPPGKVRIVKGYVGGGFGGKQEPVYEQVNALLAIQSRRPVMLQLSREENLSATRTRHATEIRLKTGLNKNGDILAREMEVVANGGAYASHGHNVVMNMATQFAVLYPTPNLKFTGKTAYTNIEIAGAMRGYGIPQLNFAMESHMDHLAKTVGMDAMAFRQKNIYKMGDPMYVDNVHVYTCGMPEVLKKGMEKIGWEEFKNQPKSTGRKRRGIGAACFSYGQSCYPWSVEMSGARVMVHDDGSATLFLGCADVGQGSDTAMKQIAAEALGVPHDWITVVGVDTDICPYDTGAFASRQTYVSGYAVKKAALACKQDILQRSSSDLGIDVQVLDIQNGNIIHTAQNKILCSLQEEMMRMTYSIHNPQTISNDAFHFPTDNLLTFGAAFAVVEVDISTGMVEVEKLVMGIDCGRLINPLLAESQAYSGCVMSMGMGLKEQLLIDPATGRVLNDNLLDYKIPTFADVPQLDCFFVETDEPTSAYGNKSLGEPPNIPPACAIRNAVVDATGVMMNELPLTPERVLMTLKKADSHAMA